MKNSVNPEMTDRENPEWTDAMFAKAKRGAAASRSPGRPRGSNKVSTTIRIDADIIEAFKQAGSGWQSRMNDVLRASLKEK